MPHGTFYWNELMTSDVDLAKRFYGAAIGWTYESMPMPNGGTYWVARLDGKPVAGVMAMVPDLPPGVPPHWFSYIEVDDVDTRLKVLEANGGKVVRAPFEVEGVGRIAIVSDPTGAVVGWITPVGAVN
jgi:predicted enzyme related to lactoylglutathione lyase